MTTTTTTTCRACGRSGSDVIASICKPCRSRRDHRHGLRLARETADQREALDEVAACALRLAPAQLQRLRAA
jgi:hypothetical protein